MNSHRKHEEHELKAAYLPATQTDPECGESKKKFVCNYCPQSFTFQTNRRRHVLLFHTSNIPQVQYQCHICNKKFRRNNYLTTHITRVHEKMERIMCKLCFKVFSCENSLSQHMQYIHDAGRAPKTLFQCHHCSRQFNRKTNLAYHIQYTACNPNRVIRPTARCQRCGTVMLESYIQKHLNLCLKRKTGRKRAGRKITIDNEKKTNLVMDNEKVSSNNDHQIKKEELLPIIKAETDDYNDHNVGTGELTCLEFFNFAEHNIGLPRRSERKRNHIEYKVLNGEDSSDSESAQPSVTKENKKTCKKRLIAEIKTEQVDNNQID